MKKTCILKSLWFVGVISLFQLLIACEDNNSVTGVYPRPAEHLDRLYNCARPILMAEQSQNMAIIVDSLTNNELWSWRVAMSDIPSDMQSLFNNIDEVKAVYSRKYIILTASTGGVAMVRISDRKLMFYAYPKGNPHSIEILPDGNIVVATSTGTDENANSLLIYKMDTLRNDASPIHAKYSLYSGHNAVWDRANRQLIATTDNTLRFYEYNYNPENPALTLKDEINLPDKGAHDMFPVYGENALWLTTTSYIYKIDLATKTIARAGFSKANIKSVSSGPSEFGTLLLQPTTSHWSNYVTNDKGEKACHIANGKIYKARWFIDNSFSYPPNDEFKQP